MKDTFKPLALAAAVAAVSAGFVGLANAQSSSAGAYPSLGDAAIVPYYTVQEGWVTGVHIINTSELAQVVKFRMRRATDSADVLDFNLVLSPHDEWVGSLDGDATGMKISTTDKSCTVPAFLGAGETTTAPVLVLKDAQEGYIEIIGMGAADSTMAIYKSSLHVSGKPVNCDTTRSNFFPAAVTTNASTKQGSSVNSYTQTDNVLKVSYFLRNVESNTEFGGQATHFSSFSDIPMMTHQQYGLNSYAAYASNPATSGLSALNGFDFPDLRGGGGNTPAPSRLGMQNVIIPALGASSLINDWSYNEATGASTDWTVTFPGQYTMVDIFGAAANPTKPDLWNFQQLPVVATFTLYDREEGTGIPGGLNFSPSPAPDAALLPNEVNVITWGDTTPPVLDSAEKNVVNVNPAEAGITSPNGWASLEVEGDKARAGNYQVCDVAAGPVSGAAVCSVIGNVVPMVGFVAWQRTFDDPDKNYGRIVEHSFDLQSRSIK